MTALARTSLTRRNLLTGTSAVLAAGVAGISPSSAKAPMANAQAPSFYRFKLGAIEATVVSDGPLALGDPGGAFKEITKDEIGKLLADNFLPADTMSVEQNALVLNTGDKLVLIDTGLGPVKAFGPTSGRLLANLAAAGIDSKDIDAVVVSHAHPDHLGGIMGEAGSRNFPNAQFYITQADFDFWTDEGKLGTPMKPFIELARANLVPNRDRIVFVTGGQEILPGLQVVAAPGHTVGHVIFMIASGGKSFAYTADVAHHYLVATERPRAQFVFDTDADQAVATRLKTFDMLATDRIPFLSYHFPWPGIGHLARQGTAFRYVAAPIQTVL